MPLDPYAPCPCGSGKKLKFCCSHLTAEMEKISRMLEGDQRAACLQHIKVILPKHPHEPSLLGLRAMLELELEQFDDARQTIGTFLQAHPEHPMALAERATLLAFTKGDLPSMIEALQKALEAADQLVSEQLYEAIGAVGTSLLERGHIMAALAHIVLQVRLGDGEDKMPLQLLVGIQGEEAVPLLLKDEMLLSTCEREVPWKGDFETANEYSLLGQWRRAESVYQNIVDQDGDAPEPVRNLALVQAWQAKTEAASETFRRYATLKVPLDDAVEAAAIAVLLDSKHSAEFVEIAQCTFPILQLEALEVAFSSDPRLERVDVERTWSSDGDEPPPRSAFRLFSKPVPKNEEAIGIDDIPETAAQLLIYGKQTDRAARLELYVGRDERMETTIALLRTIAADAIGEMESQETVTRAPLLSHLFSRGWVFPASLPVAEREALYRQLMRRVVTEVWFRRPLKALAGKTIVDAARDPKLRCPVLAQLLILEQSDILGSTVDVNQLRKELDLPTSGPIDPKTTETNRLPLVRLGRVRCDHLEDEPLLALWRRAGLAHHFVAARRFAQEILSRESLQDSQYALEALALVIRAEPDSTERLELIERARKLAEARKASTAVWDLRELSTRIERREGAEVQRLIEHLIREHQYEPGVIEAMQKMLVAAGILQVARRDRGGAVPEVVETVVGAGPPPDEGGKIWTPDQQSGGGEKKTIWTPGDG